MSRTPVYRYYPTTQIYALSDPRDFSVRYVGRTVNLRARLAGHQHPDSHYDPSARFAWIKELRALGLKPVPMLLEECRSEDAAEREALWIERFSGPKLLNGHKFNALPRGMPAANHLPPLVSDDAPVLDEG